MTTQEDREARRFLVNYNHNGSRYCIEVSAASIDDAYGHIKSLLYGEVIGEAVAKVPAAFGPFVALITWLRNLLFMVR